MLIIRNLIKIIVYFLLVNYTDKKSVLSGQTDILHDSILAKIAKKK